jgi:hypothetical protein
MSRLTLKLIITILTALSIAAGMHPIPAIHAQQGPGYEVELPDVGIGRPQTPADYVRYIYILGLGLGGLLAFAMIVFAGLEWTLSGANPSLQEDAKDRIRNAIFGLLLLLGAYIILRTINPNLVSLQNPSIRPLPPVPGGPGPGGPGPGGPGPGTNQPPVSGGPTPVTPFGPPDPYAVDLAGYSTVIQNALRQSPFGADIGNMDPEARQSLINMIECAARVGGSVKVNSAYRPQAYQDHLKEIFCKYSCAFQGRDPADLQRQYPWVNYCSTYVNFPCTPGRYDPRYQSALDSISMEWSRHGPLYAPASSGSAHSNGCGVDMNVSGINPLNYGFWQPISRDDPVHFNHFACPQANRVYNPACGPNL